jgi:hypothetical protein
MSRRIVANALVVLALAVSGCRRGPADVSEDRVEPVPPAIPYLRIPLPRGAKNYYAHESGLQSTMLQLRFEMAPADVKLFERQLPCRLGPEETGPPQHALVGTNDRSWYRVEAVNKHRSCLYHHDIRTAEFLLDLDDPAHVTVYAVISND